MYRRPFSLVGPTYNDNLYKYNHKARLPLPSPTSLTYRVVDVDEHGAQLGPHVVTERASRTHLVKAAPRWGKVVDQYPTTERRHEVVRIHREPPHVP